MAFLKCSYGAGGGNNIELVVTCSSEFAGLTITATDGSSTLAKACPLTSPYEVTFELPNFGTWTVSGTIGSKTYSESVIVDAYEVELFSNIDLNLDVYSAANDTVFYSDINGQTRTMITDSSGHATAQITIDPNGSTFTFVSSVAKNPNNLSSNYEKNVTLSRDSTSLYIMPDESIYWYGYGQNNLENVTTANGWTLAAGYTGLNNPTFNTNDIYIKTPTTGQLMAVSSKALIDPGNRHMICKSTLYNNSGGSLRKNSIKRVNAGTDYAHIDQTVANTIQHLTLSDSTSSYVFALVTDTRSCNVYALWSE